MHMNSWTPTEKKIINNVKKQLHKNQYELISSNQKYAIIKERLSACLHIIQDEMGSAFIISKEGHILTCDHCVYNEESQQYKDSLYFIFPSGNIVQADLIAHDQKFDCALLKIKESESNQLNFNFFEIASNLEPKNKEIYCIGQPGYDDLESKKSKKTNYTPFEVSKGKVKGYLKNTVEIDQKTELGPLIHTCWTYWGHSGAPIFNTKGQIIGMHNSWNDKNANRHGMTCLSIQKFLQKYNFSQQIVNNSV